MAKINITYCLDDFMKYKDMNNYLPVNLKPICNDIGGTVILRDLILKEVGLVIDSFSKNYYNTFNITSSAPITFTTTASYIDSCSNQIIFNATGGLGNYTYFAQETDTGASYSSTSSVLSTFSLNGGIFAVYVQDTGSCI
jgi:hypothetical protein